MASKSARASCAYPRAMPADSQHPCRFRGASGNRLDARCIVHRVVSATKGTSWPRPPKECCTNRRSTEALCSTKTRPANSTASVLAIWSSRCRKDVRRERPVDGLPTEVALGVDECGPRQFDISPGGDLHDGDLQDAVVPAREQPGGLHIDNGVPSHDCPPVPSFRV